MSRTLNLLVWIFLLVGLAASVRPAWAQDERPQVQVAKDRESPSALYDTFMRNYNIATKRVDREREPNEYRRAMLAAIRCLQRQDIDPDKEDEVLAERTTLAEAFKDVLDYHGRIDSAALPGASFGPNSHRLPLRVIHRAAVAERTPTGWSFTIGTVDSAAEWRAEYEALGEEKFEFRTARDYMPDALLGKALFMEHWQWLGLLAMLFICLIVDRIVVFVAKGLVGGLLLRTKVLEKAGRVAEMAGRPFGFFGMAAVIWLLHPQLDLRPGPFIMAAKIVASIGAILLLFRVVDVFAERMREAASRTESKLDDQLVPLLRKSLKVVIFVGGVLFILDNLDMDIMSLLAGVSVAGLAVSFAARDTVANLFGSVTVFLDKPFQVGDWILINGVEGSVEEVGFRTTSVRTFYNSRVSVPNSLLVTGVVDNMGERKFRRFKTVLGVQYDTPPERIEAFCQGIREIVAANEHMRQDAATVYLNGFGASSLDILVYVFFVVPDWDMELRQRQNFIVEILRLARELDVEFAFPTQTLHMSSTPDQAAKDPKELTEEELCRIVDGFGKGGALSRPGGSERWLPDNPTPPENPGDSLPEAHDS